MINSKLQELFDYYQRDINTEFHGNYNKSPFNNIKTKKYYLNEFNNMNLSIEEIIDFINNIYKNKEVMLEYLNDFTFNLIAHIDLAKNQEVKTIIDKLKIINILD